MINKESLQLFVNQNKHKEYIIDYWDLTNNSLHIVFVGGSVEFFILISLVSG
jgi:hypothetical protein